MATTIDPATKVNLGVLITLLGASVGGGMYLEHMETTLNQVGRQLVEVKAAIDRNTAQLSNDGRTLAIVGSRVDMHGRAIDDLTKRVTELEKAKE